MRFFSLRKPKIDPKPQSDLIFDFGVHRGYDSEFYLAKGFRVVGLEAVPALCALAQERLAAHVERLTILNMAFAEKAGQKVTFYTVPDKDDWGSLNRNAAEKGIYQSVEISVETTNLSSLFDVYGVPHYIKCDLEGADTEFCRQLAADGRRPTFVSAEVNEEQNILDLAAAGYDRAQIVNQWMHTFTAVPSPAREGTLVEKKFNGETSGLFGLELDPPRWLPIEQALKNYSDWRSLHNRDGLLAPGWVDCHVCHSSSLPNNS